MDYKTRRSLALRDVKQLYLQLKDGEIQYKSYKTKVKNTIRKYGSRYEKDEIRTYLCYKDIDDKKYYMQSFIAGDFDFNYIININLVDFKYEEVKSINEIPEADFLEECYIDCFHNGLIDNFS